jgi:hypothetical protein
MGGDQIFNGDARVFAQRFRLGHSLETISLAADVFKRAPGSSLGVLARLLVVPHVVSAMPALKRLKRGREATQRWPWAGPRLREVIADLHVNEPPDDEWKSVDGAIKLTRLESRDLVLFGTNRRQKEALTGLRQVDPLIDDEVVNLVASFPQHELLFGNRMRGLFRHAVRGMVPEGLRLRRDKAQFEPAIREMLLHSEKDVLRDLSNVRMLHDLGLVEAPTYRRHFKTVLDSRAQSPDWMAIWPALTVEAFLQRQRRAGAAI